MTLNPLEDADADAEDDCDGFFQVTDYCLGIVVNMYAW